MVFFWQGPRNERKLFVISHKQTGEHVIELFDVELDGTLLHKNTISHALIQSPNDLVATGPDSFYVTNDHGWRGFFQVFENFLGLAVSNVVYYHDGVANIAVKGLAYANGINLSADGNTLYVAEITKRRIKAWQKSEDEKFEGGQSWSMRMAADNLEWDEKGRLWTAGHPNALAFLKHAKDSRHLSPSMASVIDIKNNFVSEVLYTDGSHLNAASVAAVSGKQMFIGAVFDDKILHCSI